MPDQSEVSQVTEESKRVVEVVKGVENAIRLVQREQAVAVYEDTYLDQIHPNYLVFRDEDKSARFAELLETIKSTPGGTPERIKIFGELNEIAGTDIETGNLHWIYRNEEWAIPPEGLIADEISMQLQEEDWDWFETQREHFEGMEEDQGGYALEKQSRRMQVEAESHVDEEDKDDEYPYDEGDDNV